jgi:hypothetical protein
MREWGIMMRTYIAFIPGEIDLQAGLDELRAVEDHELLDRAHLLLLGWGLDLPFIESPEPSWDDFDELTDAELNGVIPAAMQERYLTAVRESLEVGIRNAAILLSGEHSWFETFVAERVPLSSGGEMLLFAEGDLGSDESSLADAARLPVDVLPQVGRAMGVLGREAVAIHITATDGH